MHKCNGNRNLHRQLMVGGRLWWQSLTELSLLLIFIVFNSPAANRDLFANITGEIKMLQPKYQGSFSIVCVVMSACAQMTP